MGKRGPRPTPTALRVLQGNPSKRPLNPREPRPPKGAPEAPPHLDAEGRAEWDRVVGLLERSGLMTQIDRAALAGYCHAWSRWLEAEAKLKEFGSVLKAPKTGFPMLSPYWTIANTALKQIRDFAAEFGMSPASRSRLYAEAEATVPSKSRWAGLI